MQVGYECPQVVYGGKLKISDMVESTLQHIIKLMYLILPVLLHTIPPSKSFGRICLGFMFRELSLVIPSNSTLQTTIKNACIQH